jgi:hypothetical protein
MAAREAVCAGISPADRELFLHAAQPREHSDRRWQIRHASCKALAARDKEPAPNPWPLSNRPSRAYEGKPKSATLSLSPPRARSGLKKDCFRQPGTESYPTLTRVRDATRRVRCTLSDRPSRVRARCNPRSFAKVSTCEMGIIYG